MEPTSPPATPRGARSPVARLAHEVSDLQAALLGKLHAELAGEGSGRFASAAQKLALDFGAVTATAVEALLDGRPDEAPDEAPPNEEVGAQQAEGHVDLYRPGAMRHRLDQLVEVHRRYGHPFGLAVFDAEGPGTRNGGSGEGLEMAQAVLGAALHDSVRLVDETYPLGEGALCVLAPNQDTVGGVRMAERLLRMLDELEEVGGLQIGITAGVVACPEHGDESERLLHRADEAMWRARAVGQPVGVGTLQN